MDVVAQFDLVLLGIVLVDFYLGKAFKICDLKLNFNRGITVGNFQFIGTAFKRPDTFFDDYDLVTIAHVFFIFFQG